VREIVVVVRTAWRHDRSRLVSQVVLTALSGLLSGVGLLLLVPIVQAVGDDGGSLDVPVVSSWDLTDWGLRPLLALFVAAVAVQAIVSVATAVNSSRLQQGVVDEMRRVAFAAVLRARWDHVTTLRKSDVIQVVTSGSARAGQAVAQVMTVGVAVVVGIATAVVTIMVSPGVGSLGVLAVMVAGLLQSLGIRRVRGLGAEFGERNRDLQAVVTDSLDSLRLVRAHDAAEVWHRRLLSAFASVRTAQVEAVRRQAIANSLTTLGLAASAAIFVLVAFEADVEPAAILLLLVLVARLSRSVQTVSRASLQLANLLPAVGDVTRLTETAIANAEHLGLAEEARGVAGETHAPEFHMPRPGDPLVELIGVSYTYPGSERGLQAVTLRVPAGSVTAVTGRSGAGKSTLVDVVLGLLRPSSGEVRVAGTVIDTALLPWWRQRVAYVPQETVLFPGSVRDNLTWSAHGKIDDEAIWGTLRRAAADFAADLPDGLDTMLGDRGVRLSGGERQRLAIARALLRDPALLVLDEATSALDDETEAEVLATLRSLVPAVTVLVVAHRRSTLESADHVIRVEDGSVSA